MKASDSALLMHRRTLLRGAGAALALPWLETMSNAAPADESLRLSEPPLRMMFLFMPNGVRPDYWTPPGDAETDYPITPHLKPLEGLRNDFILLENLWNKNSIGRNGHWPKVPIWLSGGYVQRTTADDLDTGAVLWTHQTVPDKICTSDTAVTCSIDGDCPDSGTCVQGRGAGVTATVSTDETGEFVYMNTVGCYTYPSIGDSDTIFKLNAATGATVWKARVQPPERRSFGSRLIERSSDELDGESQSRFDPAGLCYRVSLPLTQSIAPPR